MTPPQTALSKTVLLCCVSYRDEARVRAFAAHVAGLPRPPGWRLALAAYDNGGGWDAARPLPGDALAVPGGDNPGYSGGCERARRAWMAQNGGVPAWTALLNTDIEFEQDFFVKLLGAGLPPDAGVVAPDVRLPDGAAQNPYLRERPTRRKMLLYRRVFLSPLCHRALEETYRLRKRLKSGRAQAAPPEAGPVPIYAPHGAAVFFRAAFFERGGTLLGPGFMYGEEYTIAETARKAGLGVVWLPGLVVRHEGRSATGAVARRRRLAWVNESMAAVWAAHFAGPGAGAAG